MSSSDVSRRDLPNDLSADPPDKLHELQRMFLVETAERLATPSMIKRRGGVSK